MASINLFSYAANNPINLTDSLGLKPGDIYLFTKTEGFAKTIASLSPGGSYGHAAIELPGGVLLTADLKGVRCVPFTEALRNAEYDIFRPTGDVCEEGLQQFANAAVLRNSAGYHYGGLVGIQLISPNSIFEPFYVGKEYTCAEVVWWASFYSGNYLGMMGTQISPNEISKSSALHRLK